MTEVIKVYNSEIRDYGECLGIDVFYSDEEKRLVIRVPSQCGYDCTIIDLEDVVEWYTKNKKTLCQLKSYTKKNDKRE